MERILIDAADEDNWESIEAQLDAEDIATITTKEDA